MRLSRISLCVVVAVIPWVACTGATVAPSGGAGGAASGAGAGNGTGGDEDPLAGVVASSGASGATMAVGTGGAPSCTAGAGGSVPGPEVCGNGKDEDANGFIDEGCACPVGVTQECFPGKGDLCECKVGVQTCVQTGEFGEWGPCEGAVQACTGPLDESCEVCGNNVDDDCDGLIDEGCVLDLEVNIDGDCVTASCPPQAANPIACNIVMDGNDSRGCVAHAPGSPIVYFQEGDNCGAGHVSGSLKCSSQPGAPLDAANCPINKSQKYYKADKNDCP